MASTEIYSLASDFSGGLDNLQLKTEINNDGTIVPNCPDVTTDDDVVVIHFASALSGAEQTNLDTLVAGYVFAEPESSIQIDEVIITNVLDVRLDQLNKSIAFGAERVLDGTWVKTSGDLTGFNLSTGLWTCPSTGIYSYNLSIKIDDVDTNTWLKIKVKNTSDVILYGNDSLLIGSALNSYKFIKNCKLLESGDTIKFIIECDVANIECDLAIEIVKLLGVSS